MKTGYVYELNGKTTGEVAAINNCTKILTDPEGKYKLSGAEALKALSDLSLYTTAEPCPMVQYSTLVYSYLHAPCPLCYHGMACLIYLPPTTYNLPTC